MIVDKPFGKVEQFGTNLILGEFFMQIFIFVGEILGYKSIKEERNGI